jgi:Protein of unknown function (DUF1592)/Protein of unknown function (DUF1588)/PA14 domain/Protein of unknown function (DUF1595)/Cytochrome C oxidase, cbb3-type, subunit III
LRRLACAVLLSLVAASPARAADGFNGEQIYRKQCAECHGASGEGVKDKHPKPLAGDKSAAQLARLIAKTMPEDDPGSLSGTEAEKVAAYVFDTFYSPAARERNKPPRVELARLTVAQYRNAVADLIGSFRTPGKWDDRRGLQGDYFNARGFRRENPVLERVDPEVRFDFGTTGPQVDKFDPSQFSIRWEGAVLAPETGNYDFIVRTEHAARLWVNDTNRPLIDAWVKSGNDTEYRASIFLVGGRAYPLRLEFSKAKQGVDDSKKNKDKPPPRVQASVVLLWKEPQKAPEVIPARNLSPNRFPEVFAVETPFPPDDRSLGWERGTAVSKAWDQATTDAAITTASYVAAHLDEFLGVKSPRRERGLGSGNPADINLDGAGAATFDPERPRKLREFCRRFVERAFRQPLTDEQQRIYVDHQFDAAQSPETAVQRVVLLTLLSPRFLYREVGGGPDGYDVASRLAFALWDSAPDQELLDAAAAGKLATRDQIARQAERMLADTRARAKLRGFFLQWLKVDAAPDIAKDAKRFPGFDVAVASDLRSSLELFLDDIIWSPTSDFRNLLLSEDLYLNGKLAKFYGVDLPPDPRLRAQIVTGPALAKFLSADQPFQKVTLVSGHRAGVLTHPYLMAAFAYTGSSSPIHRGIFLARGVLGMSLRPPPEAFAPLPEDLHPTLTTRERVTLQTRAQACQSCHAVINPLGFTLEHFDAVGRYRDKDNGKPVDASGTYETRAGKAVTFHEARDLAIFLADSSDVHEAFAEQLFHHLVKQPVRAYGPDTLAELRQSFAQSGFNIRKLAVQIAIVATLPPKPKQPGS